jgi:hypothetical protein
MKLERPTAEELVRERLQQTASPSVIHQRTAMGLILCRAPASGVVSTRRTQFVTCPECRQKIDELVDAVFAPL